MRTSREVWRTEPEAVVRVEHPLPGNLSAHVFVLGWLGIRRDKIVFADKNDLGDYVHTVILVKPPATGG
ncbi:uncharacterized protein N7443_005363 [Penicillium atrosanguineum]|uniref:uncharacterized protein n=1 Tax=Penicillium atrosanguineum TaxID=1132637 RepID=UPI00239CEA1F|nr:uncharacterized protein N7443_005363 [Penicillium atrosanguineum]KAJ5300361.1 hypothetical protein N7443_005363 [Penicillium atrosanguineum]